MLNSLFQNQVIPAEQLTSGQIGTLFAHSIILGFILAALTYVTMIPFIKAKGKKGRELESLKAKLVLGSSNILFLCIGLTVVMILVNNNLARALSIGATMGLIRFRVKIGQKNLGSNLLFGIIVGVACGIQQIMVAWISTAIYVFLQLVLFFFLKGPLEKDPEAAESSMKNA